MARRGIPLSIVFLLGAVLPATADAPPASPPLQTAADCSPADEAAPMPIDLPTALQLADASNPTIALARARVREAYYRVREAQSAFLPSLYGGPAYARHDGLVQNSTGLVFPTNKWNLFNGGGASLDWDTSTMLFAPLVAKRLAQAQAAQSQAVRDNVQLDAALTYLDLLQVYAQMAVNADTLARAEEMLHYATIGEKAGMGKTTADITRARTEVSIRREERIDLQAQSAEVSAHLAQLLLLEPTVDLRPAEPTVVPIALVPPAPLPELVATAVLNRPELAEGRALIGAAQVQLRQARLAPLLPHLNVGYTSGEFRGGINDDTQHIGSRGDGTASALWELHGLGLEDLARARTRRTQVNEANIHVIEVQAQVAAEVASAAKVARARQAALADAQTAVREANETWERLRRAQFGMAEKKYDPLETLLAEQALNQARTQYLNEVIEFNKAEFRLYWAMGQPPLCALPQATALPVTLPVVPPPYAPPDAVPMPRKIEEKEGK